VSEFDDQPLLRTSSAEPPPDSPPPRTDSRLFLAIGLAALVLGAFGAWWWTGRRAPVPRNTSPAVAATEGAVPHQERPLPPVGQMDTFLRALIGAISSHPQIARWLATDDLIRQMADGIDKISRGQSPAKNLTVLKPQDIFEIRGTRGQMAIDARSYHRYDGLAAAVASLNAKAVAQAYRTIEPRLDEAYRGLGRSENNVDEATDIALNVLLSTPEVDDPIRVVHGKGATYAFADPRLESLAPIQKQLIRMGPQNQRIVLARLREIRAALDATPTRLPAR
jgi:Protein of unknown function (DUF3014)